MTPEVSEAPEYLQRTKGGALCGEATEERERSKVQKGYKECNNNFWILPLQLMKTGNEKS